MLSLCILLVFSSVMHTQLIWCTQTCWSFWQKCPNTDLYQYLELPVTASQQEIRTQYKKLVLKYHPDKNNGDTEKLEKFKRIQHAYTELYTPPHCQQYELMQRDNRYACNIFFTYLWFCTGKGE